MRIARGMAYTLTNWVTLVDAILYPALLIGATFNIFA